MAQGLAATIDRILGEEIIPSTHIRKTRNGHEFEGGIKKSDGTVMVTKRSLHSSGVDTLEEKEIPKDIRALLGLPVED